MADLDNALQNINDSIQLLPVPEGKILSAQLQIFKALRRPLMLESVIDIILQNLHEAIGYAKSAEDKKRFQLQASATIQHLIYITKALLIYDIDKNQEEARNIIVDVGNNLIQAMTSAVHAYAASQGSSESIKYSIIQSIQQLGQTLLEDKQKKSLWRRIVDWWFSSNDLADREKEYLLLIINVIEKLGRYKKLVGKSILLAELIRKYEPEIVARYESNRKMALPSLEETSNNLLSVFSGIIVLLLILLTIGYFVESTHGYANNIIFFMYKSGNIGFWQWVISYAALLFGAGVNSIR